ncbi:hypothetical protein Ancab_018684, partial [Ancistrocladus abbreviatus]
FSTKQRRDVTVIETMTLSEKGFDIWPWDNRNSLLPGRPGPQWSNDWTTLKSRRYDRWMLDSANVSHFYDCGRTFSVVRCLRTFLVLDILVIFFSHWTRFAFPE